MGFLELCQGVITNTRDMEKLLAFGQVPRHGVATIVSCGSSRKENTRVESPREKCNRFQKIDALECHSLLVSSHQENSTTASSGTRGR